jgi:alanine racemase
MKQYYRVCADINLNAVDSNIEEVKKALNPGTKLMIVLKADGYGHGAVPIAKTLNNQADAFGVAIVEEGIELRKAGIKKPILILGYSAKELYDEIIEYDIIQTIFQYETAEALNEAAKKAGKKAFIHIKIDTGMSRIGFSVSDESLNEIIKISKLSNLVLDGIFTHFAKADEIEKDATRIQYERFIDMLSRLEAKGITFRTRHVSNSAAIIDLPEYNLDMVRCGICTYGLYPSEEVQKNRIMLTPAMELKTHIAYIKEVPAGCGISYNGTYVTEHSMRIATIPVGYGDGYPRLLSSKGRVLIHGKFAPILGRVCMDQFMVDVSGIPEARQDDEVTLLGKDGYEAISVEELSRYACSFNYEFVCDVGKRIPRVYFRDGKQVEERRGV